MHNLLYYGNNYSVTSGHLLNYYKNYVNDNANENVANYRVNNNKTTISKLFEYKTKLIGSTTADDDRLDTEFFHKR